MDQTAPAPPVEPARRPGAGATIYERIRDDIVQGRLAPNARLKTSELAHAYGTSTNPVREALQQLRGEGFVVITPNRGARVRAMDDAFVRDVLEIEMLLEPHFTRWFVEIATDEDIARLEALQQRIEETGFDDTVRYSELDTQFHRVFYDRHYNQHALDLWWRHRDVLGALSRHTRFARWREEAIIGEHRALIEAVRRHDVEGAAKIVEAHVRGSGQHLAEQIRARRAAGR
ncbi:MAG TPA: GntR family transcriptional regulator [Devosiaceae bacterium]|nr:GntR family transcriptional regulator [Devosiaceae bacterium]